MIDKMREDFEAWAVKSGYNTKMIVPIAGENSKEKAIYANGQTRSAWQSWQASRTTLVVELPPAFDAAMEDACYYKYAYLQDEVEKALDAAGVKYE